MGKMKLQVLIEAAILAAAAMVLDFLPSIKIAPGISVSFAMVPVFIVSFRWGWRAGVFSGFLWGFLQVILGDASILHPVQALVEYFMAFAAVGVAGFFVGNIQKQISRQQKKQALFTVILAIFSASVARYFFHFIAGYYFWGSYAPEGMSPVWYSFIINGSTMVLTFILCAIIMSGLFIASPRLIQNKEVLTTE
ncbi:energy-coupled thiamine transporter ThiT [Pueribacillus theae]|uniref:Energy-coupled thiamine transporter ThiT n=1 Tax=Pueribacillus theae TaxID=2171751 RepID=A0A2U1K459_9BACI|nr:energy-coupled thiamine transporter ThiT [Pueribacillus theae]PWA11974.1 energy-coupled thiamine transporter ThiT [Pueribacillus theae]